MCCFSIFSVSRRYRAWPVIILFDNWLTENDRSLRRLQPDLRFAGIIERLDGLNEIMHRRLAEAEQSGSLDRLMAMAVDSYGPE